jgi:hypothetical protein
MMIRAGDVAVALHFLSWHTADRHRQTAAILGWLNLICPGFAVMISTVRVMSTHLCCGGGFGQPVLLLLYVFQSLQTTAALYVRLCYRGSGLCMHVDFGSPRYLPDALQLQRLWDWQPSLFVFYFVSTRTDIWAASGVHASTGRTC